jgi:lauroyl/myristoyl acyltransferase
MGFLIGWAVRLLVACIQLLPLDLAAQLGRCAGALAWFIDRRHRVAAIDNLSQAIGSRFDSRELHQIGREHFRRLGENYVSAIKTASMSESALQSRIEVVGLEGVVPPAGQSLVAAIGHFGNFEIFARLTSRLPGHRLGTTYKALRPPELDAVLQRLRRKSGVLFFERTRDAQALRSALQEGNLLLALLSDQHAGERGLWIPFFGRHCSTSAAPAIYALRFQTPLTVAICYRTRLAHWRIEVGPIIPTLAPDGSPRTPEDILTEIHQHFEAAILRDPANWFWVHRRWKKPSARQLARTQPSPVPDP